MPRPPQGDGAIIFADSRDAALEYARNKGLSDEHFSEIINFLRVSGWVARLWTSSEHRPGHRARPTYHIVHHYFVTYERTHGWREKWCWLNKLEIQGFLYVFKDVMLLQYWSHPSSSQFAEHDQAARKMAHKASYLSLPFFIFYIYFFMYFILEISVMPALPAC